MAQNTTPTSQKKIIILGGSYAGISTAHYLLKHAIPHVPDKDSYEIIIVSPSPKIMCRPASPRAMISDDMFPQEKLFVSIPKVFAQYPKSSFSFIHGTATELDHTSRIVSISKDNQFFIFPSPIPLMVYLLYSIHSGVFPTAATCLLLTHSDEGNADSRFFRLSGWKYREDRVLRSRYRHRCIHCISASWSKSRRRVPQNQLDCIQESLADC